MKLRYYQEQVLTTLRLNQQQHKRQIVALPTGAGKTVVATEIIKGAIGYGNKVLFVVERVQLAVQAYKHFTAAGIKTGLLQGENTQLSETDEVIVASIQTIKSRKAPIADVIIIDECHLLYKAHISLIESWDALPVIGLSATPLNPILGKYFSNMIRGATIKELIENKYLVKSRVFCPAQKAMDEVLADVPIQAGDFAKGKLSKAINSKRLVGDIINTWKTKADNRKTLSFAVDVAHSKSIVEAFINDGIEARHLDGNTTFDERQQIINDFVNGDVQVLSSCNVLSVGFDVPNASCLILARPTLSESLFIQQAGRGLRPADNKDDCLILDHAGNTLRFGLPDNFIVPDLHNKDKRTSKQKRKQYKLSACTNCDAAIPIGEIICPECGHDRPVKQNEVSYHDSNLVEFNSVDNGIKQYTPAEKMNWLQTFVWMASHSKSGKIGAAYYSYKEKFNEEPPMKVWDVIPQLPTLEQSNWMKHCQIKRRKTCEKVSKKIKQLKQRQCPVCNSFNIIISAGTPPHDSKLECNDCGHHRWLPKTSHESAHI